MNNIESLQRLVDAVEKSGANVAPTYQEYMPMAFAIVIQITPIVAALPNDVPVRKEINELMTKTAARNHWDLIIGRA